MTEAANGGVLRLPLAQLHERHPGLTEAIAASFAEAAGVCLSRYHASPCVVRTSQAEEGRDYSVEWSAPDGRAQRAWANVDEATEFGACGVALAAAEAMLGLVAIERADRRIGADYYVAAEPNAENLEMALRLEISGVDHGSQSAVAARLREKVGQARRGESNLPAMAVVVGFLVRRVMFEAVEH